MPKITHVKKAQQRYERVPVIDEATGEPKVVPVNRTTKRGTAVTMTVTRDDLDQPLPPYDCDYCRNPIEVGTPYKHISPRSGPYGGRTLRRHEGCPTWQPWDYSGSLSARLSQITYEFDNAVDDAASPADAEPGRCGCALMDRLTVHVCDLYAGQPLRVTGAWLRALTRSGRTEDPGGYPVPPRGCGTHHAGECTSEWPYTRRDR